MKSKASPMLDIIVTHYKEPWSTVEKFFSMLDLQRGVSFSSFRVLFVNDGEENAFPSRRFSDHPYKVLQFSIPHAGVSSARNEGLSKASSEWVMFCDCDDTFTNIYSMMDILNVLPAPEVDLLWTDMYYEYMRENELYLQKQGLNGVFIHGKLFRRQFLLDHHILFDPHLPYCEDSLFVTTAYTVADSKRIGRIAAQTPPYVWCYTEGSVTNSMKTMDKAHTYVYYRNKKVCEVYRQYRPYDQYCSMIARTIIDSYYALNAPTLSDPLLEMKSDFKQWYSQHKSQWQAVPYDTLKEIKEASKRASHASNTIESISVTKWLNQLEQED